MKKGLVSILVPVYNVQKFLLDCLKSIEGQTYKNIEVIFVNDGSTDNSKSILEEFCNKHKYAKIINQKNQGLPSARNTAIKYITGEFFYILDSDDIMNTNVIETFVRVQKETSADVVTANFKFIKEDCHFDSWMNKQIKHHYNVIQTSDLCCATYLSNYKSNFARLCWNKLCKTSILKQINSYPKVWDPNIIFGEDTYFMCLYLPLCKKACCIKDKTYFYRKRNQSISKTKFNNNIFNLLECVRPIDHLSDKLFPYTKINQKSFLAQNAHLIILRMYKNNYINEDKIKYSYEIFKQNIRYTRHTYKNFWVRFMPIIKIPVYFMYKRLLKKAKKNTK